MHFPSLSHFRYLDKAPLREASGTFLGAMWTAGCDRFRAAGYLPIALRLSLLLTPLSSENQVSCLDLFRAV